MPDETPLPDSNAQLQEQVEYLRGLAQIVAETGLAKLEIEAGDLKMTLKAPSFAAAPAPVAAPSMAAPLGTLPPGFAPAPTAPTAAKKDNFTPLVSPMVGVFYRAPSPSDPNFVEIGDRVERGQTIGLVEAMKVFNEITAESAGVVAQISVETGQLVETGQALLLLQ